MADDLEDFYDGAETIGELHDSLAPGESTQRGPYVITRPTGWVNPGSDEAQTAGCICPVMDNNRGKYPPRPPKGWWMRPDCAVHAPLARVKGT